MTESRRLTEGLLRTNPVLVLNHELAGLQDDPGLWMARAPALGRYVQELRADGVELPASFLAELVAAGILPSSCLAAARPGQPGVVGLLVDHERSLGLVTPLSARRLASEPDTDWQVARHLPFKARDLQDLLLELVAAFLSAGAVPERLAFAVDDALGEAAEGSSMDVAGLLAVIDALHEGKAKPLRAACAVVEPSGSRGELRTSAGIELKLAAFVREYDRGTLLVRHPSCDVAASFDDHFETVWQVDSLASLGKHLYEAGLLGPLLAFTVLGGDELERINERLERLCDSEHRYLEAIELARRVLQCDLAPGVPRSALERARRVFLDARRHRGSLAVGEEEKRRYDELCALGDFTSFEALTKAAVNYAASLYDLHRFEEMVEVLSPWQERLAAEPRLVSPKVRYMLFNTLARAHVALGQDGWEPLYAASLRLQERLEPAGVQRTRNYRIHGLLRSERLDDAEAEIELGLADRACTPYTGRFLAFYQADVARRRGRQHVDLAMEELDHHSEDAGHPGGFYFQATARQPGRSAEDAAARFEQARRMFLKDISDRDKSSDTVLVLLASAVELAHAAAIDAFYPWQQSRAFLKDFIESRTDGAMSRYYKNVLHGLPERPDPDAAERLLTRIPFF